MIADVYPYVTNDHLRCITDIQSGRNIAAVLRKKNFTRLTEML